MKSAARVASPPEQPLVIFDGDCNFCRVWIRRWQLTTGDRVDYAPYQNQDVVSRFPEIPTSNYETSVHLIETNGDVFTGAEAAFRALAHNPEEHFFVDWYDHSAFFARNSERFYRLVAHNRSFFSFLTRTAWGKDVGPQRHDFVRGAFVRSIAAIFLIAFLSLWTQLDGLVGKDGIAPAADMMHAASEQANRAGFHSFGRVHFLPTFCWAGSSDRALHLQCFAGAAVSALALLGIAQAPALFIAWLLYLSLSTVCREFLSFQWDTLLLETGLLAAFFAPARIRFWRKVWPRPSVTVLWLLRWLMFRLMFESACVKLLSKDPTWHDLTALSYHYETQPLPTWVGWFAHQMPAGLQHVCVVGMFLIELVLPFFIFAPRRIRHFAAGGFVLLQIFIFLTGNYCFFNLLTIALCIPLLDDTALVSLMPAKLRGWFRFGRHYNQNSLSTLPVQEPPRPRDWFRPIRVLLAALILPITLLQLSFMFSVPFPWPGPVLATYQWFAPFRTVNTYGLFAVMTTTRPEIVIQGSNDGVTWLDYEFKYKPQELNRRPGFVAPHQPRLDWQMWFAALGNYRQNPWLVNFCIRLLQGSQPVIKLLRSDPFPHAPPKYIRALVYEYHFTSFAERRQTGNWWRREPAGEYLPVIGQPP